MPGDNRQTAQTDSYTGVPTISSAGFDPDGNLVAQTQTANGQTRSFGATLNPADWPQQATNDGLSSSTTGAGAGPVLSQTIQNEAGKVSYNIDQHCPHCAKPEPYELGRRTALGYRIFRCRSCKRTSNERTGTPFNHLEYPTDVVLLVVRWRLQYNLSLRNLAAMFLERGIVFTHEAVREWEERFAPLLAARLRARRKGKAGTKSGL